MSAGPMTQQQSLQERLRVYKLDRRFDEDRSILSTLKTLKETTRGFQQSVLLSAEGIIDGFTLEKCKKLKPT